MYTTHIPRGQGRHDSSVRCSHCKVHLCVHNDGQCFQKYHNSCGILALVAFTLTVCLFTVLALLYSYLLARASEQGKLIGIYIIYMWIKKNLNRTLAIDSPFQTFAVGILVEFID